jgi:hypothetical protein
MMEIDQFGTLVTATRFEDLGYSNFPGWANTSARTNSESFVLGGSRVNSTEPSRASIYVTGPDGVIIDHYHFGDPILPWYGRQAKQAPDGGEVLVGERTENGNSDGFLLKTNSSGEQDWVQTYGGDNNDAIVAVHETLDGGYFLGGLVQTLNAEIDLWVLGVPRQHM